MSAGEVRSDLVGYVELIDRFAEREIDADQFETEYLGMAKNDEVMHGEPAFGIIDELFFHVDEYFVPPEASEDERSREQEALRTYAQRAVEKLRAISE
jgi:hypothetical protein